MDKGFVISEDRFRAVSIALNQAAFKYEVAKIDYVSGPEVINARDTYLRHVREFEEVKENLLKYHSITHGEVSFKTKSKK